MNATPERVANPDEDGGVHVLALGKLRKGSGRYTGGKTHLRTRHPPVNEQFPKPIVAESHKEPFEREIWSVLYHFSVSEVKQSVGDGELTITVSACQHISRLHIDSRANDNAIPE